jgi:zinc transporter, ZIP family
MKIALALVVAAAALGAGFVVLHGMPGGSGSDDVEVTHATLEPGHIVLTLQSHADHVVSIAQAIVNDAYVNFDAGTPGSADISIDYPWIDGESYEIELLTSTGSSVDFEIEDAGEAS